MQTDKNNNVYGTINIKQPMNKYHVYKDNKNHSVANKEPHKSFNGVKKIL